MSLKEFAEKSLLKPWDVFIILLLTVLSFLPVMIFGLQQNTARKRSGTACGWHRNQNIPFDGWRREQHIYLQR